MCKDEVGDFYRIKILVPKTNNRKWVICFYLTYNINYAIFWFNEDKTCSILQPPFLPPSGIVTQHLNCFLQCMPFSCWQNHQPSRSLELNSCYLWFWSMSESLYLPCNRIISLSDLKDSCFMPCITFRRVHCNQSLNMLYYDFKWWSSY